MKYEQLCTLIHESLLDDREISPNQLLSSDLGLCSFDMMVIIGRVEEITGHQINLSDIKKDMTVQEFFSIINY